MRVGVGGLRVGVGGLRVGVEGLRVGVQGLSVGVEGLRFGVEGVGVSWAGWAAATRHPTPRSARSVVAEAHTKRAPGSRDQSLRPVVYSSLLGFTSCIVKVL